LADEAAAYLQAHREELLRRYLDFLRIPSQSALAAHRDDVARAAAWVAESLRRAGCPAVEVAATTGHPVVVGRWPVAAELPTVLIYGHYDVQPADPLELWETPPFEPVVRDGRVYARGASDDKGGVFAALAALEAVARTAGQPPCNLVFLFEGEEEVGSPSLPAFVAARRRELACDVMLSADGGMFDVDRPSLTVGFRGIASCQIDVYGARTDLHSGQHGGAVANPLHALAAILASLHDADGRVAVAGFYDRVRELTPAERAELAEVPFDDEAYRQELGVPALFGEAGRTTLERLWTRPTLEVNGMWGGFQGDGSKTVLPREAHAKITCRLVPDQDPDDVLDRIAAHLVAHTPPGVTASLHRFPGKAQPYLMPRDLPELRVAARVLASVCGREPLYVRAGGTIPVTQLVRDELGVWTVALAFGQRDENVHAPNEFYRLDDLWRNARAFCDFWQAYAAERRGRPAGR
jgi:acetylornithine deacetylase/succinyl-diaminopimelate desuccinylase-like protein